MMRSSVFGCQPISGFAWMKRIPNSKLMSSHVRCSISPFRMPVNKIVEKSRRSSSLQAA
jgi:hypothetical protein